MQASAGHVGRHRLNPPSPRPPGRPPTPAASTNWDPGHLQRYVMAAAANIPGLDRYADVAKAAGIDPSTLSKWWRGMRPTPDSLDRLTNALCLTDSGRAGLYTVCGYTAPAGRSPDPLAARIAALIAPDNPLSAEVRLMLAAAIAPYEARRTRNPRVA